MTFLAGIKSKTKNFRHSIWNSKKKVFRIIRPIYLITRFILKSLFNYEYRNQKFTYMRYKKYYYQFENSTEENRYPDLFTICQKYFKNKENVKILSFGCSTGEEVDGINKYMPNAIIVGADISHYNLKQCKKKDKKENISFVHSLSVEYKQNNNFDAIFCMAVLQHTKNRENVSIATKFIFEQFENEIIDLDKKLNEGGLFFIDQTDFNFLDTSIRNKYFPLMVEGNIRENNTRPLFNSENIKISEINNSYRVFQKKTS